MHVSFGFVRAGLSREQIIYIGGLLGVAIGVLGADPGPDLTYIQGFIREVLALQRQQAVSAHLEVETYTWNVLPEAFRSGPVEAAIARELDWVRAQLA